MLLDTFFQTHSFLFIEIFWKIQKIMGCTYYQITFSYNFVVSNKYQSIIMRVKINILENVLLVIFSPTILIYDCDKMAITI